MSSPASSFDWRLPAIWAALLTVSVLAHTHVEIANETARGVGMPYGTALAIQVSSHLVVAALLPVIYWLHRRFPIGERPRNLVVHGAAVVPFSIVHTVGMAALRFVWFGGILGKTHSFPLTLDRMLYEFAKDIIAYGLLSAGVVALRHYLTRPADPALAAGAATPRRSRSPSSPHRVPSASRFVARAGRSWSMSARSTGSKPRATTPSFMSAGRGSRSAPR